MDPDPTSFVSDFTDEKKISYFFIGTLSSVLKVKLFAKILCIISVCLTPLWEKGMIRIRIRIGISDWRIQILEAQKNSDPADPDPQHYLQDLEYR